MMTRKSVLGVLIALSAVAVAQPAAAQWYDRGAFGVGVGFGAAPAYGYAAYGPGCTCPPAAYAGYTYGGSPAYYSSYAYGGYPSAYSYSYSDYGYAYPRSGYASVGIGVTDRSFRSSRIYRGPAMRERQFVGAQRQIGAREQFSAVDSRVRAQGRSTIDTRRRNGSAAAARGRAGVASGGGPQGPMGQGAR
jgi:hypothetical protein